MLSLSHELIAIVGPTATGKTALAQALAERLHASILSADSMQIYRGMDIGTGKIPPDKRSVPYFGIDIVDLGQPYSAALFQRYGRNVITTLDSRDTPCVLCGGTGFYVRAVVDAYDFPAGKQRGNPVRDVCSARMQHIGPQALWQKLADVDPASAHLIHPNDTKRVIRAFELLADNTSYATQRRRLAHIMPYLPTTFIGLTVDPDILAERISKRVDNMMELGLVEEVESLLNSGLRHALTALQAIGYKEIIAAIDGKISFDEAVDQIKTATRRYAKRQRTWFRKDTRIHWLDANDQDIPRLLEEAEKYLCHE